MNLGDFLFSRRAGKLATLVALMVAVAATALARKAMTASAHPDDEQTRQTIRKFVARTVTLIPLKDIQIAEFDPPDRGGLRKVVVNLLNADTPISKTFYVTANSGEILEGTLQTLTADPWKDTRAMLGPIIQHAPANGPADAPVNLVEFSDFQCPFCRQLNPALEELQKRHPSQIRWIFLNYPLVDIHPWAKAGATTGVCVADQSWNKFWTFEPMVYEQQREIKPETAPQQLRSLALAAGADAASYDACVQSQETADRVKASIVQGQSLGVNGTPTLFVNGRRVVGGVSIDSLEAAISNELEFARRK